MLRLVMDGRATTMGSDCFASTKRTGPPAQIFCSGFQCYGSNVRMGWNGRERRRGNPGLAVAREPMVHLLRGKKEDKSR